MNNGVFLLVFFGIMAALIVVLTRWENRKRESLSGTARRLLNELATRLQLTGNIAIRPDALEITDSIDDVSITIVADLDPTRKSIAERDLSATLTLKGSFRISGVAEIRTEVYPHTIGNIVDEDHDIVTGDREFDRRIFLEGKSSDAARARALMDKPLRDDLVRLCATGASFYLRFGSFTARIGIASVRDRNTLAEIAQLMRTIGARLAEEIDIPARLLHNATTDPVPEVRLRNLRALTTHFPDSDTITAALERLLGDESVPIQIESARALGDRGVPHLVRILRTAGTLDEKTVVAMVAHFRRLRSSESVPALAHIYDHYRATAILSEVMHAFAEFGDERVSALLAGQLDRFDGELHALLIEALGTCGTVDVVERLYAIGKNSLNPFLRNAVQKSIAKIQARLGNVDAGWLSLPEADGAVGGLSVADGAKEGGLSVSGDSTQSGKYK